MSHFSDIGFKVNSTKDLQKISKFIRLGKQEPAIKNKYCCVTDKSGSQLWFWYSEKGIACLNPHFAGKTESTLLLTSNEAKSDCANCVTFTGWMSPIDPKDPESGLYPCNFSVPNFFQLDITLPKLVKVQISAFAENIQIYADEKEFSKAKKEYSPNYFIPAGCFPVEENRKASAMFAGKVISVKKVMNSLTWRRYYWIVAETYGTKIDIVCDGALVKRKVRIGNIVDGTFWLSGKINLK